jgi:hypothetical protein
MGMPDGAGAGAGAGGLEGGGLEGGGLEGGGLEGGGLEGGGLEGGGLEGGVGVLIVHVNVAAGSLPKLSTAFTENVYVPSVKPVYDLGEVQSSGGNDVGPDNSHIRWFTPDPVSLAENVNIIESIVVVSPLLISLFGSVLGTLAEVMVVSGAVVSTTVTVKLADPLFGG